MMMMMMIDRMLRPAVCIIFAQWTVRLTSYWAVLSPVIMIAASRRLLATARLSC